MCTVVLRRTPGAPVQILALRDELVGRDFDDPGAWWPTQPDVVGGRDQVAGGTWCATSVTTGVSALVLNRAEKRIADAEAPSRGALPLIALARGADWVSHIETAGMASFTLVLAGPESATVWDFDGTTLASRPIEPGTVMFTSGGVEDGRAARFLPAFAAASFPQGFHEIVASQQPSDAPDALLVLHEVGDRLFATVFGQLIAAAADRLGIVESRTPWKATSWTGKSWP